MRSPSLAVKLVLVASMASSFASARETAATATSALQLDCKAVTSYPGAVMTFTQCQAQNVQNARMSQVMNSPAGDRPGDDRMTCDQIIAELKTTSVPGVSVQHAAAASAAGQDLKQSYEGLMAKTATVSAAGTVRSMSAAVVDAVTGTKFAGMANQAANQADQLAVQTQAKEQFVPARDRARSANFDAQGDIVAMMRANPRMGRLTMLAQAKNCSMQ